MEESNCFVQLCFKEIFTRRIHENTFYHNNFSVIVFPFTRVEIETESAGFTAGYSSLSVWCKRVIRLALFIRLEFCELGVERHNYMSRLWLKICAEKMTRDCLKLKVTFYRKKIPWYWKIPGTWFLVGVHLTIRRLTSYFSRDYNIFRFQMLVSFSTLLSSQVLSISLLHESGKD